MAMMKFPNSCHLSEAPLGIAAASREAGPFCIEPVSWMWPDCWLLLLPKPWDLPTGKWYPSKGATLLWAAGVRLAWVYKYRDDPSVFKIASILFGVQNIGGYWGILGVFSMIMYDHWDSYHLRMNWNHWLSGSWVVGGISSAINQWPVQVQRKDIESRSQMWQTECLGLGTSAGEPSFLGGPNWVDPRINQDFCLGVSIESRIF